tara:strand:+ start:20569 stop:21081 length:513 start_codon:yes stop_codon:yes gene_type:complete
MGYQKLQTGRSTVMDNLWWSDSPNSPNVNLDNLITLGSTTASVGVATRLVNNGLIDFIALGVKAGDLVISTSTGGQATRVASVQSSTTLWVLEAGVFYLPVQPFAIYSQSTEPATLYVDPSNAVNALKVTTMGGDIVTFNNLIAGSFIPVQISHIWDTGTSGIQSVTALF